MRLFVNSNRQNEQTWLDGFLHVGIVLALKRRDRMRIPSQLVQHLGACAKQPWLTALSFEQQQTSFVFGPASVHKVFDVSPLVGIADRLVTQLHMDDTCQFTSVL